MKVTQINLPIGEEKTYGAGMELIAKPSASYNPVEEARKLAGFLENLPYKVMSGVLMDPRFRRHVRKAANALEKKSLE